MTISTKFPVYVHCNTLMPNFTTKFSTLRTQHLELVLEFRHSKLQYEFRVSKLQFEFRHSEKNEHNGINDGTMTMNLEMTSPRVAHCKLSNTLHFFFSRSCCRSTVSVKVSRAKVSVRVCNNNHHLLSSISQGRVGRPDL